MAGFVKNQKIFDAEELTEEQLKALDGKLRLKILKILAEEPLYPAKIAKQLEHSKQKIYYHFEKLQEAELIQEDRTENQSGGEAVYYKPTHKGFILDLGAEGQHVPLPEQNTETLNFFKPLITEGKLDGKIVVGSPDEHGPDQVRARDGHLATEIAFKLGNYSRKNQSITKLDTEIVREENYSQNLLMLGGVLTNVVSKKFNKHFPVKFATENFPYQEIQTPKNSYTDENIGFIAKTSNPEDHSKSVYMVAGVQSKGTQAAVKAFQDLEKIVENYSAGQFHAVVKGLDLNSDGQIDDYKVIETSE